jgi:hypothetical protein
LLTLSFRNDCTLYVSTGRVRASALSAMAAQRPQYSRRPAHRLRRTRIIAAMEIPTEDATEEANQRLATPRLTMVAIAGLLARRLAWRYLLRR